MNAPAGSELETESDGIAERDVARWIYGVAGERKPCETEELEEAH